PPRARRRAGCARNPSARKSARRSSSADRFPSPLATGPDVPPRRGGCCRRRGRASPARPPGSAATPPAGKARGPPRRRARRYRRSRENSRDAPRSGPTWAAAPPPEAASLPLRAAVGRPSQRDRKQGVEAPAVADHDAFLVAHFGKDDAVHVAAAREEHGLA